VITPQKTFSPSLHRLISAIFDYYDRTVVPYQTYWLEPLKFSSVLRDAGKNDTEYPILTIALKPQPSIDELRMIDVTFYSFYQNTGLDFRMVSRPELVQYGSTNSMPVLSRDGFEEFWLLETLLNPATSFLSMQSMLSRLPRLVDPETQQPFLSQRIPRDCFPAVPDPQIEVYAARLKQRQEMMANEAAEQERANMEAVTLQNMELQRLHMQMAQHNQLLQAQMMGRQFVVHSNHDNSANPNM